VSFARRPLQKAYVAGTRTLTFWTLNADICGPASLYRSVFPPGLVRIGLSSFVLLVALVFASSAAARPVWRTGFERAGFDTWNAVYANNERDVRRVRSRRAEGRHSARFRVTSTSCPLVSDKTSGLCKRERAQLQKVVGERAGTESWWSFKILWPRRYRPTVGRFNIFMEWHGRTPWGGCGPNLSFSLDKKKRHVRSIHPILIVRGCSSRGQVCDRELDMPALRKRRWHNFRLHVRWATGNEGLVELWVNGKKVGRVGGPNVYHDALGPEVRMLAGIYRSHAAHTAALYVDAIRHGTRARDVAGS
jgi:hypothetical protein